MGKVSVCIIICMHMNRECSVKWQPWNLRNIICILAYVAFLSLCGVGICAHVINKVCTDSYN